MQIHHLFWTDADGWCNTTGHPSCDDSQLVLLFASLEALGGDREIVEELRRRFPNATLVGCSTAGEITGTRVLDDSAVATALHFETTRVRQATARVATRDDSYFAGGQLARELDGDDLVHVLVFSEGLKVNGSQLARGLTTGLRPDVKVTGGLAGDGDRFQQTSVLANGQPTEDGVVAIGFYGPNLSIGFGSIGGWDPFGPERLITRSEGNVLYELDGRSALALYRLYLGEHAKDLPSSGLLFPLCLRARADSPPLVRTILAVNEYDQSLTFAGDVPEGSYARLMKANFDRLIDGAVSAAQATTRLTSSDADLALLISCVGRKLVLRQRVEEEVEGVREVLGDNPVLTGFYSYGEISPATPQANCDLHNQTMTITTFREDPA